MSVAVERSSTAAKTFSRVRIVETIKGYYRIMKENERNMQKFEQLSITMNDKSDYYHLRLIESMTNYTAHENIVKSLCSNFGVTTQEIEISE